MSSVNKAILVGNVGRDPEIRVTQGGSKIANFSLATGEKRKNKQTGETTEYTEWHRIVAFGNTAEVIEKYVSKGTKLYVEGRIYTRKWEDKDGQDRYTTEITADQITMLGGKDSGEKNESSSRSESKAAPKKISEDAPFDDEIPF